MKFGIRSQQTLAMTQFLNILGQIPYIFVFYAWIEFLSFCTKTVWLGIIIPSQKKNIPSRFFFQTWLCFLFFSVLVFLVKYFERFFYTFKWFNSCFGNISFSILVVFHFFSEHISNVHRIKRHLFQIDDILISIYLTQYTYMCTTMSIHSPK